MKKVILILAILFIGCSSDDGCECDAIIVKVKPIEWQGEVGYKYFSESDCYEKFDNFIFTFYSQHQFYKEGQCLEYNDINRWL